MTAEAIAALAAATARWLTAAGVLGLVGSACLPVVEGLAGRTDRANRLPRAAGGLAAVSIAAWIAGLAALLAMTILAWFGPPGLTDPSRVQAMLRETRWGVSWTNACLCGVLAALALAGARRPGLVTALGLATAALLVAIPTPMLGHASGHGPAVRWLHVVHLLGAGMWLGTLLALAIAAGFLRWRARRTMSDLRPLLRAFAPVALVGATLVIGSGLVLSVEHVWPLTSLFDTWYGRTLAAKTAAVGLVVVLGGMNWRRLVPMARDEESERRLVVAIRLELLLAFALVLGLTAWLTGLPMPGAFGA